MDLTNIMILLEGKLTKEDYINCYTFLSDEVDKHNTKDLIPLIIKLKNKVLTLELFSSRFDIIFINILIIRAHMFNNHAWRARNYVLENIELLEDVTFDKDFIIGAEIYKILGDASSSYLDCKTAYICYGKSVELYLKTDYPLKYTAYIAKYMLISIMQLPNALEILPSKEEIIDTFKEYSTDLLKVYDGIGYLKHDPVEQSKEFQMIYDDVMEEVEQILVETKIRNIHYIWTVMTQCLEKRGINWKSIAVMNPRVKFD